MATTVKKNKGERVSPTIDQAGIDPKDVASITRSVQGKEQAPTTSEQSATTIDWKTLRDQLGQPFDVERIPLKKLRQMRRDPMIAFGLHVRKTPLVRAQWHMEAKDKDGPNAQIAGFMDAAWRPIHARYIFQHTVDFDFGFANIVKRFGLGNPGGVYFDPLEENPDNMMKPVWDEGTVEPVVWKPFVNLPPERVTALFTKDGEFDGMSYEVIQSQQGGRNTTFKSKSKKGSDKERIIDVYHSLWATNDKDSQFGSIYGYPLIGHAFRFWWSYWFLWANLDRAFERFAVPPMVAYHPDGEYTDLETNDSRPNWEIAIEAAENLRSNAIAAVPSTLATAGLEEKATQLREWAFEFVDTPTQNFDALAQHLSYLDIMKLRSIWIPEQAIIEGDKGSGGRNVSAQMGDILNESQANKWEEIADHINRYILPQLLAVNFPEFVNNGGTCKIIGHGFAKEDTEFLKQLVQLIGQGDPASLGVDIREALNRIGTPLKSPQQLAKEKAALVVEQAAAGPPQIDPSTGQVGTVPNPGFTNGGSVPEPNSPGASVTGFADQQFIYANPRPHIELSEHDDYLAGLPPTGHYEDKTMRALSVQLRRIWLGFLRDAYPDFAKFLVLKKLEFTDDEWEATFADEPDMALEGEGEHRSRTKAEKLARRLLREWEAGSVKLDRLAESSRKIMERMVKRAAALAKKNQKWEASPDETRFHDFLDSQIGRLVKSVHKTTKDELRRVLIDGLMDGKDANAISIDIQDHFTEFPDWRADRIARSETRDAYNAGTLIAAESEGIRFARAKDAQKGPTDDLCEERDGKIFTIKEAWKQMGPRLTHPNDTLEWEPVARAAFSIVPVEELPEDAPEGAEAWFHDDSSTAYVPVNMSDEDMQEFLGAVVDHMAVS